MDTGLNLNRTLEKFDYPKLVNDYAHVVCAMDYTSGDPAQADIEGLAKIWFGLNSSVTWFTVDDLSPLEVGFNLATRQVVQGSRIHPFTVFLGNAAPRKKENKNLEAAPFVVFKLKKGVIVVTTLSETYDELACLDLDSIDGPIHQLKLQIDGTQYRSLYLPEYAARYCLSILGQSDEGLSELVDESHDYLPAARKRLANTMTPKILHIDNFGNIKLTLTENDEGFPRERGQEFQVEINGQCHTVVKGKHLGDAKNKNKIIFYPGSSVSARGRHMELGMVDASAAAEFKSDQGLARCGYRPRSGSDVKILM